MNGEDFVLPLRGDGRHGKSCRHIEIFQGGKVGLHSGSPFRIGAGNHQNFILTFSHKRLYRKFSMRRKTLFLALIIGRASQLLWASPRPPKDVYVVHFILDGLRYDVFKKYVESGNYPDIKKYFVDK